MNPSPDKPRPFVMEQASFSARQTELSWTFGFAYDAVWDAVNSAAGNLGMTLLSMDRAAGLTVAKPPFSLLNIGRRIAVTFQKASQGRTRVRAVYLHGVMCLTSRHSRQQTLDALFRSALAQLNPPTPSAPRPAPQAAQPRAARQAEHPANHAANPAEAAGPVSARTRAPKTKAAETPPNAAHSARSAPETPDAAPQAAAPASPPQNAKPSGPRPARPDLPLQEMDFRHIDPETLPLTPPSGSEASRYRLRPPLQRPSGIGRTLGWFILGLGIAVLGFILSGGLSLLFRP